MSGETMNDTRELKLAPATQARYATHRRQFEHWCSERERPMNECSAKAYILEKAPQVSKAWILQARSAIGHFYQFTDPDCTCWECVCGKAHRLAIDPTATRMLTDNEVRDILQDIDMVRLRTDTAAEDAKASRDACIISLIRANDLRGGQILELNRSDWSGINEMALSCRLGDHVVKRRRDTPTLDPVARLEDWCRFVHDGPLFRKIERWGSIGDRRLHHRSLGIIVKKRVEPLGYATDLISPESFRKPR